MLLKQQFKTLEGVQKRVAFENAHSRTHQFKSVRCVNGEPDTREFGAHNMHDYTWRIEKTAKPRRAT